MEVVMKKYIQLGLCMLLLKGSIQAQHTFEAGFSLGFMQYDGDIGGRNSQFPGFLLNKSSPISLAGSLNFDYSPIAFLRLGLSATWGQVQGADSLLPTFTPSQQIKKTRNLHFKSPIQEASLFLSFHPILALRPNTGTTPKISPYLLLGASFFKFNPKGWFQNPAGASGWVDLKPLRTEGQGMATYSTAEEYDLIATSMKAGLGIRYTINERISLSYEFINGRTSTDFLDDVSGRYIDNNAFDQFFGLGSKQALMARQLANYPSYSNGGIYPTGFNPGSLRGSAAKKDYFYSSSVKMGFLLGNSEIGSPLWKMRQGIIECTQF